MEERRAFVARDETGERLVRGVQLAYGRRGAGAPALLVHEAGVSSTAWEPVARALASGDPSARAIAYDRRGWGASTAPDGYRRTTIEEQSEDAAGLLEALGDAPAVLCGAGIGALIALDLLLRRPELVLGAVLVEPPLLALVPAATEALSADLDALAQSGERGHGALADLYLDGGLGALGAGAERLPGELTAPARERPAGLVAELAAPSAWAMPLPRLAQATRPSLLVTCGSTPPLLLQSAAALAARLALASEAPLANADGPPHLSDPEAIAALTATLSAEGRTAPERR